MNIIYATNLLQQQLPAYQIRIVTKCLPLTAETYIGVVLLSGGEAVAIEPYVVSDKDLQSISPAKLEVKFARFINDIIKDYSGV